MYRTSTLKAKEVDSRTLEFQWTAAHLLIHSSTFASKSLMLSFHESKNMLKLGHDGLGESQYCAGCGNIFASSDDHSVIMKAKKTPNRRTVKALKRVMRRRGSALAEDRTLVDNYNRAAPFLAVRCKTCRFTRKMPGASRESVALSRRRTKGNCTPGNTATRGRATNTMPYTSTPKSDGKEPPSSKSQRKKKLSTSRLSNILKNESNSSLNSSLQDFLSSL